MMMMSVEAVTNDSTRTQISIGSLTTGRVPHQVYQHPNAALFTEEPFIGGRHFPLDRREKERKDEKKKKKRRDGDEDGDGRETRLLTSHTTCNDFAVPVSCRLFPTK